jgi:hypothetical protein
MILSFYLLLNVRRYARFTTLVGVSFPVSCRRRRIPAERLADSVRINLHTVVTRL